MRLARPVLVFAIAVAFVAAPSPFARAVAEASAPPAAPERVERCDHGVKKAICTRCNPKLAPVFKAKGDWCPEHDRPESQCVRCNPRLAKEGVK